MTRRARARNGDNPSDSKVGEGRVVANFGQRAAVRTTDGLIRCHIRRRTGLVVCGDLVRYRPQNDGSYLIEERLPRHSSLLRPDRTGSLKAIAANIDRILIVIAPRPEPDWVMVNAFITYAVEQQLRPLIVLNKIDRLDSDATGDLMETADVYANTVCPVLKISCRTGEAFETLTPLFERQTGILVGQSGVGKSSIVQTLLPDQAIQTRAISETTGLGNHTTTTAMLYRLQSGNLIDSPGIRRFDITHLDPATVRTSFAEFQQYAPRCRFADCSHVHEPDCAVKTAVENSQISEIRWQHYKALLEQYAGR